MAQRGKGFGRGAARQALRPRTLRGVSALAALLTVLGTADVAHAVAAPQFELSASDGAADDRFGASVAIGGDVLAVGAVRDDDRGTESGSVYVFGRGESAWTFQQKLTASDGKAGDRFGISVALDGDTLVVGAYDSDDSGTDSGSAYVFQWNGAAWAQVTELHASDAKAGDLFGASVAVDGDTALIGAPKSDPKGSSSGAGYVFVRSGGVWSQQAKLAASDGAANDLLGYSVSLSGDTALVGAAFKTTSGGSYAGAAYAFVRSGTSWTQQQKLVASDGAASDNFGNAVSLDGDTAVVGAYGDDTTVSNAGSAYVYTRSGATWSQQTKLASPSAAANDNFGTAVSLRGGMLAIGAALADAVGTDSGAAFLFQGSGASWTLVESLVAADGAAGDAFGVQVAVDAGRVAIGAYLADVLATDSGEAYVYDSSRELSVATLGTGSGTVTSDPSGIDCGGACVASFALGATVTLTAAPALDSDFVGWSGAGCAGLGTCAVSMSANRSVSATFDITPNLIFADGFDLGDLSRWSATVGAP